MHAQLEEIWEAVRQELRREVPDFKFQIWLEPLELAGSEGHTLYVQAPEHIRTSVAERYLPLLRRAATSAFHEQASVEIVAAGWRAGTSGTTPSDHGRTASKSLNPKYTFEQFVIGESNHFAHAASLTAAEMPAQAYNPLFLHGSPGLGKTHLLHAIGNYVERHGGGLRVRYATIEEFTTEFVTAVRNRRTDRFKETFRNADVVLIDDVQFLAGRARTCEEFFHTFNTLLESRRQLVITSDRSPEELVELESRLAERFRSGLVVELQAPSMTVREAILTKRARVDRLDVTPEVVTEIAGRVKSSVRALEGALIRVVAYSSLKNQVPTPELARRVLHESTRIETERPSLPEILDATAQELHVDRAALLARDRRPAVALARQIAMYLARELTDQSLPEIGRGIGGRNHTTVMHAVGRIGSGVQSDQGVHSAVANVRKRLEQAT